MPDLERVVRQVRRLVPALASAWLLSMLAASPALAGPVAGVVVHLSGPMVAQRPDGTLKPLAQKSAVESGDTLRTQADAYALLRFIDNSEITLKPSTTLLIQQFAFERGKQADDQASFQLLKGGMRAMSGLLGQRSKEKFFVNTPSAQIGIRGTNFILEYLDGSELQEASPPGAGEPLVPPAPVPPGGLPPGLHVYVSEGGISLVNSSGQYQYDPGQFGYIKDGKTKPVKMTRNPGMQFTVPASFLAPPPPPPGANGLGY